MKNFPNISWEKLVYFQKLNTMAFLDFQYKNTLGKEHR